MQRRSFLGALSGACLARAQAQDFIPNRPKVPGALNLHTRRRDQAGLKGKTTEKLLRWEVAQTAIIICDMWDAHTCSLSAQRVAAMAPRMNNVVSTARSLGVMIIHSPSATMKFYEGAPERRRMQQARTAPSPFPLLNRCPRDKAEEESFPVDDTEGGCDDPVVKSETGPPWPWTRENSAIQIVGFDGVSESGQEIYNFCKQEG